MLKELGTLILASVPIMLEMIEARKQKQAEKAEGDFPTKTTKASKESGRMRGWIILIED